MSTVGLTQLTAARSCRRMVSLHLGGCSTLQGDGLAVLLAADWPELRRLNLSSCALTAEMLTAFTSITSMLRLHTLDLGHNKGIGDAGVKWLAQWPGLASVRDLVLAYCEVGAVGARALLDSPWLRPGLKLILFGNYTIPKNTISRLRKKYGARVWWSATPLPDY